MTHAAGAIIPVTEDALSEAVAYRVIKNAAPHVAIGPCLRDHGFGYIKSIIIGLNDAARGMPFFVLVDLDTQPCAPQLIADWFGSHPRHNNMLFRVAIRQVESWLMADRHGFAAYASVAQSHVPREPEREPDAKRSLLQIARRSRSRTFRQDVLPASGTTARQGPNYNGRLIDFVQNRWDVRAARSLAPSLDRACMAIKRLAT